MVTEEPIVIEDVRQITMFKSQSFSGYKKLDVKKELLNSLNFRRLEPSLQWSAELICTGNFSDLWNVIIEFYSRFVHLGSPRIAIYLAMRMFCFKELIRIDPGDIPVSLLEFRNNQKVRVLFAEIVCVLCDARHKMEVCEIKITKEEFYFENTSGRQLATSVDFAKPLFREEDFKDIFVAVNEIAYSTKETIKNEMNAFFWVEWFIDFITTCKQKKIKCSIERRSNIDVLPKYQTDPVWILWEVFINEAKTRTNIPNIFKVVESCSTLFSYEYTTTTTKKRKMLLYFVVGILCETISFDDEIVKDVEKIRIITENLNPIYKSLKNIELTHMDYLSKDHDENDKNHSSIIMQSKLLALNKLMY